MMTATELLRENPQPSEAEVREAISGNICRCTGYQSIVNGILLRRGARSMSSVGAARFVGQSVLRVEDARILTGRGRYMDDIVLPGMLEGAFVRSDLGHARHRVDRRRRAPGRCRASSRSSPPPSSRESSFPLQVAAELPNYLRPVFRALADDKVRYVGDPVAFVVAESRYLAEDARDAVEVDYEPLDAVVTMEQAADPALPALFDDVGSNVFYTEAMNFGEPDAAFAAGRPGRLRDDRLGARHARADGGSRRGRRLPTPAPAS